jgi:hypothetical protein
MIYTDAAAMPACLQKSPKALSLGNVSLTDQSGEEKDFP